MTAAARQLIWLDLLKRARAAGFVRFDAAGVAVLVLEDAKIEETDAPGQPAPGPDARAAGAGETLPGLAGGPSGQGPVQG